MPQTSLRGEEKKGVAKGLVGGFTPGNNAKARKKSAWNTGVVGVSTLKKEENSLKKVTGQIWVVGQKKSRGGGQGDNPCTRKEEKKGFYCGNEILRGTGRKNQSKKQPTGAALMATVPNRTKGREMQRWARRTTQPWSGR